MLDKLTDSESLALRGAVLGGLLLWGSQNLHPIQKASERGSTPMSVTVQSVDEKTESIGEMIERLLNPRLTTEEEVEMCKEYLADAETISPVEDPVAYLDLIEVFEACRNEVSLDAKLTLDEESPRYASIKTHLLRCTPTGEDFSLEQLEACEDLEEEWILGLSDILASKNIEVSPRYVENFTFLEDKGVWAQPGYVFELDSVDGAFHETYQFSIGFNGDTIFAMTPILEGYGDERVPDDAVPFYSKNMSKVGREFVREYREMTDTDVGPSVEE